MQKWEYKVVYGEMDEQLLNKLGTDGWELIVMTVTDYAYIFKRPKS